MSSPGSVELEWWGPETAPAPASVVWCNFPKIPKLDPGPKARPALVFAVRHADTPPGDRLLVKVAYGTSQLKTMTRPHDFAIGNARVLNQLRLFQATRFDLDQILWLPWAKPFFVSRDSGRFATPVLSVFDADLQRMLGYTMMDREAAGLNAAFNSPPEPLVNMPGIPRLPENNAQGAFDDSGIDDLIIDPDPDTKG